MYRPRRRDATGWIVFLILLIPAAFGGGWYCGREHYQQQLQHAFEVSGFGGLVDRIRANRNASLPAPDSADSQP